MPLILPPLSVRLAGQHYPSFPARAEARNVQGPWLLPLFSRFSAFIYVDNISVNNEAFSVVIDQYDQMLRETEDNQTIKGICSQVLAKYEELVVNSDSTN